MSAAPGWYDAGSPGRVRWWDGTRWTAHESAAAAPGPGWYAASAGVVRWWDGRLWTGSRLKHGRPASDWASTEQPALAWTFGGIFLALSLGQFALGAVAGSVAFAGVTTMLLAVLWFAMAAQTQAVRRIPVPTGAPVVVAEVRPLPGEQEEPSAGWYPVAPRTSRWWTGSRWASYTHSVYGIRPAFQGRRAYRTLLAVYGGLAGVGVLAAIVGGILVSFGARDPADPLPTVIGVVFLIGGILLALTGGILLLVSRSQRRILLIPANPPEALTGRTPTR